MKTYTDLTEWGFDTPEIPELIPCVQCHTPRLRADFDDDPNNKSGIKGYCKDCRRTNQREYRQKKVFEKTNDRIYEIAEMYNVNPAMVRSIAEMLKTE